MQDKSDAQLLREYIAEKSEPAFGELVRRHADLVYSAALRQVQSADWAKEIAQRVFIDLARKARSLAGKVRENGSIASWLYCATRYTALTLLREERRRQSREKQLMQDLHPSSESGPDWQSLAPFLDEAMSALNDQEHEAVLLRFFKNQDFRAVGAALGVSDDTAQKRVARSLDKLRAALARRGVTTTTAALSAALAANAVQAAPAGLAAAWIGASLASATASTSTTLTLLKIMSLTKLQIGVSAIVAGSLAVTAIVQHQTVRQARDENQALRQQIASLAADNQALSNRLQGPVAALPDDQFRELLRLRGEVGKLRQQANAASTLQKENRRLQAAQATVQAEADVLRFKQEGTRLVSTGKQIGLAMRMWANDNKDVFPTNFVCMSNELGPNFPKEFLEAYELVNVGRASEKYVNAAMARERVPRQNPQGGWQRAYVLCDGSVQMASVPDGNFDEWETKHLQQIPPSAQISNDR